MPVNLSLLNRAKSLVGPLANTAKGVISENPKRSLLGLSTAAAATPSLLDYFSSAEDIPKTASTSAPSGIEALAEEARKEEAPRQTADIQEPQTDPLLQRAINRDLSLLGRLSPGSKQEYKPMDIEVSGQTVGANELTQAQELANQQNLNQNLVEAAAKTGAAIARVPYEKVAQQDTKAPLQIFEQQKKMQDDSSAGPEAQALKQFLSKYGINVKGHLSTAALKELLPQAAKSYEAAQLRESDEARARESAQARILETGLRQQESKNRHLENMAFRKDEALAKHGNEVVNAFNKDKTIQDAGKRLETIKEIDNLLATNSPVTTPLLQRLLAKGIAGEVGVMTDQDIAAFGGSRALQDRLAQFAESTASGKLTPENIKFYQDLTATVKKRAAQGYIERKKVIAEQQAKRLKHLGVTPEDTLDMIDPGGAYTPYMTGQTAAPVGKIKVTEKASGKSKYVDASHKETFAKDSRYEVE